MKKLLSIVFVLIVVAVGYWLIAPLFITNEVDDALPVAFDPSSITSEAEMAEIIANIPDQSMDDDMPAATATEAATPTFIPIQSTPGHPATGNVRVIDTGTETIVRFEDYDGTNGPDLFVYLAKDLDATEFISLGRSKGNQGNANYVVPEGIDISEYRYVMTWCRAFGVLFDYAEIN